MRTKGIREELNEFSMFFEKVADFSIVKGLPEVFRTETLSSEMNP